MRILVFGAAGMLGHKLMQVLGESAEVIGTVRGSTSDLAEYGIIPESKLIPNVNADDLTSIVEAVETARPDVVINAVGIVKQLPTAKDVISTLTVNSIFPHRLSHLSEDFGFRLITVSTDCVFDGVRGGYRETDIPNATDLYGKSKNLGEVLDGRSLTLRTSIIGRELATAHSLVEWFLANEGGSVRGFTKAIYSGFPTIVLADIIKDLIFSFPELAGLYHVSSEPINKYDLLLLLRQHYGANIEIEPSDELRIDRSLDSSRFREETGFEPRPWEEVIARMAADVTPYGKWK